MKYIVKWDYKSSYGGPFTKGTVVELEAGQAEAINRDSPGVLAPVMEKGARSQPPAKDRMVRGGKDREK